MTNEKVLAYSTNKTFEAEMIRQYLSDNDVTSFIMNKMDSTYHFGEVEILVSRDDLIKAKNLIEKFVSNE